MGSPHLFVWHASVLLAIEYAKEHNLLGLLPKLTRHQDDLNSKADDALALLAIGKDKSGYEDHRNAAIRLAISNQVKVLRVLKCWNPLLARLEVNTVPGSTAEHASDAIIQILVQAAEGSEKRGQAPKGALERRIQNMVDRLKRAKTDGKDANMVDTDW